MSNLLISTRWFCLAPMSYSFPLGPIWIAPVIITLLWMMAFRWIQYPGLTESTENSVCGLDIDRNYTGCLHSNRCDVINSDIIRNGQEASCLWMWAARILHYWNAVSWRISGLCSGQVTEAYSTDSPQTTELGAKEILSITTWGGDAVGPDPGFPTVFVTPSILLNLEIHQELFMAVSILLITRSSLKMVQKRKGERWLLLPWTIDLHL